MRNTNQDYLSKIRYIKSHYSVTDYANNVLGMNCTEGVRCAASYRGGHNPSSFISYGDSYSDFGHPEGRHYSDVIQLCADARHYGSRSEAIKELAACFPELDEPKPTQEEINASARRIKSLEYMIKKSHEALRPEDRKYLHGRRITDQTIDRLLIGYSAGMKRIIIPYWRDGHYVYYAGRDTTNGWKTGQCPKYKKMAIKHDFDENIPWGLHTLTPQHRALFPEKVKASDGTEIKMSDYLCVLEGMFDAISFEQEGYQVLSPIGGYFNSLQIPYFLSIARSIGQVFICFDNDGAGSKFQQKMAKVLLKAKIPFYGATVPEYAPYTLYAHTEKEGCIDLKHITLLDKAKLRGDVLMVPNGHLKELSVGDRIAFSEWPSIQEDVYVEIVKIQDDDCAIVTPIPDQRGTYESEEIYVSRKCKDISDYYAAGGNLADLVAHATNGIEALTKSVHSTDDFREIITDCADFMKKSELVELSRNCREIDNKLKGIIISEATRKNENDIAIEMVGGRDKYGTVYKPKYILRYVEGMGFYEYVHGVYERRTELQIKGYIQDVMGGAFRRCKANDILENLKLRCLVNDEFNKKPIFNFTNGILELDRPDATIKKLIPHSESYLSTVQVNYPYDALARNLKWELFVSEVLSHDKKKIMRLQEFCGYILFSDYPHHKMLFLMGDGRNGKGTVIKILQKVFGKRACSNINPADFVNSFYRIFLKDSIVNFCGDTDIDIRASQEIIKRIVAGEEIDACHKFQDSVFFTTRAKLIMACNDLVKVADVSRGFISRCLFLYFNNCYEGRENINLEAELSQDLAGIFNWCLEGYLRLRRNGKFTETDEQGIAEQEFEHNTSPVFSFYDDNADNFTGLVSTQEMFQRYVHWAEINKYPCKNRGSFTRAFKKILKQKHPEIFEAYGLRMTRHIDMDYYDFTLAEKEINTAFIPEPEPSSVIIPAAECDLQVEQVQAEFPLQVNTGPEPSTAPQIMPCVKDTSFKEEREREKLEVEAEEREALTSAGNPVEEEASRERDNESLMRARLLYKFVHTARDKISKVNLKAYDFWTNYVAENLQSARPDDNTSLEKLYKCLVYWKWDEYPLATS